MYLYITVGNTIVGTFQCPHKALKLVARIAPGCHARIKKGYQPKRIVAPKRSGAGKCTVARQKTNRISYERIVYLKPGEFKL